MAVSSSWGMSRTVPLPQPTTRSSTHNYFTSSLQKSSSIGLSRFVGRRKLGFRSGRGSSFGCRCSSESSSTNAEWDWNRWTRHFSEVEQAEGDTAVLKFELEEAIEREDFQEAAKLKSAIAKATLRDSVAEIMSELKRAIDEERYHDASKLSRCTGSGLVGWWVGCAKDSDDPFGRLIRITPTVGRFIGRSYTPRQLLTASPGTPLFEIYVVKNAGDTYMMQVVFLKRSKGNSTNSSSLQPKPRRETPTPESENSSVPDIQASEAKAEKQEEKSLSIEGVTEEGIKSVINFLKDKIPGLKVKVMDINVTEDVIEDRDDVKQLTQENIEEIDESSDDEDDNLDELQSETETDSVSVEANGDTLENEKDLDMKVFIGGVVHNEDDVSMKDEYLRMPAEIKDMDRDSFVLYVPGIRGSEENKVSSVKVAAFAADGASELMPPDVAKAFWSADKVSSKVSKNVREIVKLAVNQAQKRNKVSEYTKFNRIATRTGNLDPFDGLYVGAFGPYGTEIVQLRRKFGHWNSGNELESSSDLEFFEYVEAVKLTGDLNVPAGQLTFRAKIGRSRLSNRGMYPDELGVVASYRGQGRIAEFGFQNPRWVDGELLQLNGKGIGPYGQGADLGFLYIIPEQSFLVLFNRLNLPE